MRTRRPPVARRGRRWAARLAALLLGALGAVAVAETAVRVLPLGLPPGVCAAVSLHDLRELSQRHPQLGYTMRAGCADRLLATSDFQVFRVSTAPVPGAADQTVGFRERFDGQAPWAVMVGDSFAFGWGVDATDTLEAVVERALAKRVLNFGISGQGPQQARMVLTEFALPLRPRVVLWAFYPNDIIDAARFVHWHEGEASWWRPKSELEFYLNRYCATYKLYRLLAKPRADDRFPWQGDGLRYVFAPHWKESLDLTGDEARTGLALMLAELDRLVELAREHDFTPVLVALPYREQVYRDEYCEVDPSPAPPADESAYAAVLEHARARGLAAVDLAPVLRAHKGRQLYFVEDPHLTAEGNRVAGSHLAAFLQGSGLAQ